MKQTLRKRDIWVFLAALIGAFACMTLIQFISGRIDGVASMVFLLAVFFVSMYTDGYWWGVAASITSVLAVNFAFRTPYFAFNFTIPENIFSGVVMLVVSFMTSTLTTRIKKQEQLRMESEKEKMRANLLRAVSHDLRTPLTSIRGWVETLRTLDDPSDENYRKGLEIINNETVRLYNMVEELLDFSRLQNGRLKMTCRPLDLVAELTDAVLFCEARIQREGLVLVYNEPEEMIPVYADPDRLRQVFINIMDNAIKYSAPGGRITVKLWAGEYKAFVEILDQGRGIPPEDLENVKTKFYKGSNSVRGSGIGLALVDSIMTALDGTMDIKSTLGRGTVVTLGLPLYHKA